MGNNISEYEKRDETFPVGVIFMNVTKIPRVLDMTKTMN
jgi:hypothetical protein